MCLTVSGEQGWRSSLTVEQTHMQMKWLLISVYITCEGFSYLEST